MTEFEINENNDEEILDEKSDIDFIREKYESRNSRKADEIIAVQAVVCILSAVCFFVMNMFYPEICRELYDMFEALVKDTENPVPYISDFV